MGLNRTLLEPGPNTTTQGSRNLKQGDVFSDENYLRYLTYTKVDDGCAVGLKPAGV